MDMPLFKTRCSGKAITEMFGTTQLIVLRMCLPSNGSLRGLCNLGNVFTEPLPSSKCYIIIGMKEILLT
jgi:hypothetical protein